MNGNGQPQRRDLTRSDEDRQTLLTDKIDARIELYSIRVFGYDPNSDDPKPRELLEWARARQTVEKGRRKTAGVIVTSVATAIIGSASWPIVQWIMGRFGH